MLELLSAALDFFTLQRWHKPCSASPEQGAAGSAQPLWAVGVLPVLWVVGALLHKHKEQALATGMGVTSPRRGHSKLSCHIRGELSPFQLTPALSGSTAVFLQSAVGFFLLKSVEVPLLEVLMFCKAVTDFAVNRALDVLEVVTLN